MRRFERASVALSVLFLCIVPPALKGSVQSVSAPVEVEVEVGITVEGTGQAEAAADTLEYGVGMVVGGETLPDAFAEYGRAVARLSKALDQLGLKGLTFERHGITLNTFKDFEHRQIQQEWARSGHRKHNKCEVAECLTIRVPIESREEKDIHGMIVGIMGLAAELGLEDSRDRLIPYGHPSLHVPSGWQWGISYTIRDPQRIYAKAVLLATEDANAKARLQAKFLGGRLGNVVAVEIRSGGNIEPGKAMILQHRVVLRVRYDFAVETNHGDRQ